MKKIINGLSICLLGLGLLACAEGDNSNSKSSGNKNSKKPEDINVAFAEVVKVLHAPYEKGSLFFKIFTGSTEVRETVNGDESEKMGNVANIGSGHWSVTAGKDNTQGTGKKNSIVYEYKDYQPQGSNLIVNGKMLIMYRSQGSAARGTVGSTIPTGSLIDAIGFPDVVQGDIIVDTLRISGAYEATLKFTYKWGGTHPDITAQNYDQLLMTMFSEKEMSKIEFLYEDETFKLDPEQLEKLLHVAK